MTILYDKLYRSDDLFAISLGEYLPALAREIVATHPAGASVTLRTEVPEVALPIPDTAALGMIANELLSNSLRHAFPGGRRGTVAITAERAGSVLEVRFSDDGDGLPDSVDIGSSTGFGMQLVGSLANQHGFTVSIDRTTGSAFTIRVPLPEEP
jgi:two-component sensor histidine kinase